MALRVVALAGQMGSGKSSLARELTRRLSVHAASFGSFVRAQAQIPGHDFDIPSLQQLGQELIDQLGPDVFVRQVIDWALLGKHVNSSSDALVILDGVRSQEIWQAVQRLANSSLLVYLEVDQRTRAERIARRCEGDLATLEQAAAHPMEANVPALKAEASLVLRGGDVDSWVTRVVELMAERGIVARSQDQEKQ